MMCYACKGKVLPDTSVDEPYLIVRVGSELPGEEYGFHLDHASEAILLAVRAVARVTYGLDEPQP